MAPCIRLRPERRNHAWCYNFDEARTQDGRKFQMFNVLDEFTHECLAIRVDCQLKAADMIDVLSDLFILSGVPAHIRSDNNRRSSQSRCRSGSLGLEPRQLTPNPVRRGRTGMSRASTRRCAMSF
jgi:putative transposase